MSAKAAHLTWCAQCTRWVGAARNWARWQSGQSPEWRVTRHATTPKPNTSTYERRIICKGSGILITDAVVFPRKEIPSEPPAV